MTNEEKLTRLINMIKPFAESPHCYDENPNYLPDYNVNQAFTDGVDYGENNFARMLLEQIGEDFKYPCMEDEND